MPESYRIEPIIKSKPLWKIYYPDRDLPGEKRNKNTLLIEFVAHTNNIYLVNGLSVQHEIISTDQKEVPSENIEMIMLSKQVRGKKLVTLEFLRRCFTVEYKT